MFVFLIILLFGLIVTYQFILDTFFSFKGMPNYDYLLKYGIQVASEENYFMNYGYWKTAETMHQANQDLVSYFLEMADVKGKEHLRILDVGCGYGEQDFQWLEQLDPSCHITAVDISEKQIQRANEKLEEIKHKNLVFEKADACNLPYKASSFTHVLNVESAFHYPKRFQFFKDAHKVLEEGGTFVICDIMLQDSYKPSLFSSSFLKLFSDLLTVPKENLITSSEWEQQIKKAGFQILKRRDITHLTFEPYYEFFFENWFKNLYMPSWFANPFKYFFCSTQPFAYKLVVCQRV